ncbi:MAG TPA: hypothetical protein VGB13_07930 [Candidatus Krumholzibacteria bacterium]
MKPETEALLREANAIRLSDGDTGGEGEVYRYAFDMLVDIVGDNPQPLARWEGRDWMRLLNVLVAERARADKNAAFVADLALALRDAEQRAAAGEADTRRLDIGLPLLVTRDKGIELRLNRMGGKWYYAACEIDQKGDYWKGLSRDETPADAMRTALDNAIDSALTHDGVEDAAPREEPKE